MQGVTTIAKQFLRDHQELSAIASIKPVGNHASLQEVLKLCQTTTIKSLDQILEVRF